MGNCNFKAEAEKDTHQGKLKPILTKNNEFSDKQKPLQFLIRGWSRRLRQSVEGRTAQGEEAVCDEGDG